MDFPVLLHCTVESSDHAFKIGDARFSILGQTPNATISYGPWDPRIERFRTADRLTGCEIKELPGGVLVVSGTSREAVAVKGASVDEARTTLRVTPGRTADVDVEVNGGEA